MNHSFQDDDQFVDELAAAHARLIDERLEQDQRDESSVELPPELAKEVAGAEQVFELIERVRRTKVGDTERAHLNSTHVAIPSSDRSHPAAASASASPLGWLDCTDTATAPRKIGRFTVERELGQGGYGIVFLAHDVDLDRPVAIKVPRPEALLTEEMQSRFLREGKAAALLSHPNIVPVYETGRVGRVCYIVSAYINGMTLAERLAGKEACPPQDAASLLTTLADAIQHAHSKGVYHRDLKPANILLAGFADQGRRWSDAAESARVADFGLAKVAGDQSLETHSRAIMGTPAYMPPEQADSSSTPAGETSDVYSLGAILYQLLTGRPPFAGDTVLQTLRMVQEQDPVSPRKKNPLVPADLDAICLKCLEKNPARRYATADELGQDLRRFVAGRPVVARPVTQAEYVWRWCQRNPVLATTFAALLMSLLAGATLFSMQYRRTLIKNQELQVTNDFLIESFKSPHHDQDGRSVTMASMLDRQVARVKSSDSLPDRTRSSLLVSLGSAYEGLGLFDEAIAAYEAARPLLADSDPLVHELNSNLGLAYVEKGEPASAIELLESTVAVREQSLGRNHLDTRKVTNHLAMAYADVGESESAIRLMQQLYAQIDELQDLPEDDVHQVIHNLGYVLDLAGRPDDAIPVLERAVAHARDVFGASDARTTASVQALASSFLRAGRLKDAAPLLEQVVEVNSEALGENHKRTLSSKNSLAGTYMSAGHVDKALPIFEEIVPQYEQTLGRDNRFTIGTSMNLGVAYLFANQPRLAADTLGDVWQRLQDISGPAHPRTLKTQWFLAEACAATGDLERAEELLVALSEERRANDETPPRLLANAISLQGDVLQQRGKLAAAEQLLRDALELYESLPEVPWKAAATRSILGSVLVQQGNTTEGRQLLEEGKRQLEEQSKKIAPYQRARILGQAQQRLSRIEQSD